MNNDNENKTSVSEENLKNVKQKIKEAPANNNNNNISIIESSKLTETNNFDRVIMSHLSNNNNEYKDYKNTTVGRYRTYEEMREMDG